MPEEELAPLTKELIEVVKYAKTIRELRRDDDARALWADVYPTLSEGKPGLLGAIISRAEAQVLRLSVLYAVLDRSALVRVPHLQAGLALWQYGEVSARLIFGSRLGNPTADRILAALRAAGRAGLTETEIRDVFSRHVRAGEIDAALMLLAQLGFSRDEQRRTGGRPVTVWRAAV